MPSKRIPEYLNNRTYFITLTVSRWYYLFDRYNRWEILSNSLEYFKQNRDLKLTSFVFMLNHIHLIVSSDNVAGFIRDFKRYTSKKLKENILQTEPGILKLFLKEDKYELWMKTNMPIYISREYLLIQKKTYIANNPVKKGYVMLPEHWYWSSSNEMCELKVSVDGNI